jgi:PDZ domain-containing protein
VTVKRIRTLVGLALLAGVAFVAVFVRIPYYAVGPGPARDVAPMIQVQGHPRYDSTGRLIMTTVRWYQVTPFQALFAWIDPHQSLVSQDVLYPPGLDIAEENRQALAQMDQSKIDAAFVALGEVAGYPEQHGPGALIEAVGPGCPADGELGIGDTITAIEGEEIASRRQAQRALDAAGPKEPITFEVTDPTGEEREVTLTRARCLDGRPPLVGISMIDAFPFTVNISSGDVGGPSAGLMYALGLYDALTPEDLTGGEIVAGTGVLSPSGEVGPIGGIQDKVIGAERQGAGVFLVPAENMAELDGVDTGHMRLIPVATFDEALSALRR